MFQSSEKKTEDYAAQASVRTAGMFMALGVVYCAVVIILFAGGIWAVHSQTLQATRTQATAIATFSAAYTSRMYDLGDEVASELADELSGRRLDSQTITARIVQATERTAQNDYIVVVGEDGRVIATSEPMRHTRPRQDALIAHRGGADLFVGPVVRSRATNDVIYRISRRVERGDGGFGGYVSVAIRPFGVQPASRRRVVDPQVTIWSEDGRFIAGTFVDFNAEGGAVTPPRPRSLGTVLPGQVAERDGTIHAEAKVEGLPLLVSVDFDETGVLAPWRRLASVGAAVGALLLFLGAAFATVGLTAVRRDRHSRQALERAKAEADAGLHSREMLLKEIHHRVRNSLMLVSSFVTLQARGADAKTKAALDLVRSRVTSIGVVHETLYAGSDLGLIDLDEYLGRLLPELGAGLGTTDRRITLRREVTDVTVKSEQATTIGLIVSEAVTNSVKYAFGDEGGTILVKAAPLNDRQIEVVVSDDGRGIRSGGSTGLGSQLLDALADQLGGRASVHSEGGTTVRIVFPSARKS